MALHHVIQRVLLVGVRMESSHPPTVPPPPAALASLIDSVAAAHRLFDGRAVKFGNRYRSGYWAIYVLSSVAVLFAVLPLALGWDDGRHVLHPFVGLWALCEVLVIVIVGAIYWRGHRRDWQGQWLHARTTAELAWYLPLVAPLIDFSRDGGNANWYLRVFDPGQHLRAAGEVEALCVRHEKLAHDGLAHVWSDRGFILRYTAWTIGILEAQRHYHHRLAVRQHALLHRVHGLNIWLFGLTGLGACMHLLVHTLWLSLLTTFFPALGASLHGALAQSEAYRLSVTSERLATELRGAIERIGAALLGDGTPAGDAVPDPARVKASIQAAISLILEEHQDWHMLVRPHRLPLG
ncbi:MAG: hypothetical protein JWN43_3634 [Gammaproteobacteria bacterium]|nr:hypothetical protein [Gammaproteobacteria bacterium]